MFVIFYKKSSSEIIGFRHELSSPPLSEKQLIAMFMKDNNLFADSVGSAVFEQNKFDDFDFAKYLYNLSTDTVSENPSYVATPDTPDPAPAT